MRKRFNPDLTLVATPVEDVVIPTKKKDKFNSILLSLQYIYKTPELNEKIYEILEDKIIGNKKATGRPGMDLWYILVFGVIRVGMDYSYEELAHAADNDTILRKILGIDDFFSGEKPIEFCSRTIHENLSKLDVKTIEHINDLVCEYLEHFLRKKNEKLELKADSYAFESNAHFPTDLSLAWDAARKCIDYAEKAQKQYDFTGWRKYKDWKKKIKNQKRTLERAVYRGKNEIKKIIIEAKNYIAFLNLLSDKIELLILYYYSINKENIELEYFFEMLQLHIDLIDRRLLKNEIIPSTDKIYSIFQPYTEWLSKGKIGKKVELGVKVVITTDQYSLIRDFRVMEKTSDSEESILLADRLLAKFGENRIKSLSFDKGFSSKSNKELLSLYFTNLVMPKKGRKNKAEIIEERQVEFVKIRKKHSAIESNINSLEHHGLNRCPDKSLKAFKRYVGLGVLAYNLHKIGNAIKERERKKLLRKVA